MSAATVQQRDCWHGNAETSCLQTISGILSLKSAIVAPLNDKLCAEARFVNNIRRCVAIGLPKGERHLQLIFLSPNGLPAFHGAGSHSIYMKVIAAGSDAAVYPAVGGFNRPQAIAVELKRKRGVL